MSLPYQDTFVGTDGTALAGRALSTGGVSWTGIGTGFQINTNRAYAGGSDNKIIVNVTTADQTVSYTLGNTIDFSILLFRSNVGNTTLLSAWTGASNIKIYDESLTQYGSTFTTTCADHDVIQAVCSGTSVTINQNGTPCTGLTGVTITHSQTNTYAGIRGGGGDETFRQFDANATAVSVPTAALTKANPTTVFLGGTAGSGGTTPQWSRSTTPGSGFSNLTNGGGVSGATSYSLTDGSVTPGVTYYYILTDTSGASNVQSARTWKRAAYVEFIGDSITKGFGGTVDPVVQFGISVAKAAGGQRDVIAHRTVDGSGTHAYEWWQGHCDGETGTAQSGSTSTTIKLRAGASAVDGFYNFGQVTITSGTGSGQSRWIDSSTTYSGTTKVATVTVAWGTTPDNTSVYVLSGLTNNLSTASAGGISASCTHPMITLGVNDSFSSETNTEYQANLLGMSNYLLGQGYTAVILNYPTGFAYQNDGSVVKLISLTANLEAIINNATILRGDTDMIAYLPDHAQTEMQSSGTSVHPNDTGYRSVGEAWAFAWARAVGDIPANGSFSSFPGG